MCDTLGKIVSGNLALFAKNSDRSPNEPQVIEYRPAMEHDAKTLQATYLTIEQASHTYATLLSRPVWMWGAEMGVNECGVCIGNEAVFTKGKYAKEGLTGMDLVRLGLERGSSAKEALEVILSLLKQYGQGGNCGYDHNFYYDNAFLIMDRTEIYLLETAGAEWVYKRVQCGSISNRLSIGTEGEVYSSKTAFDFAARYLEPVYSHFSGSKKRLAQTACQAAQVSNAADMMAALRIHRDEDAPLLHGDVASACMHAGGMVGDHTTSSMVVELGEEIIVWLTGSSTPCISLFKPWVFGSEPLAPVFLSGHVREADAYWRFREKITRKAIGHILPSAFYEERNQLEQAWLQEKPSEELSRQAAMQEADFYERWQSADFGPVQGKRKYLQYWEKKTEALKAPVRPVISGD